MKLIHFKVEINGRRKHSMKPFKADFFFLFWYSLNVPWMQKCSYRDIMTNAYILKFTTPIRYLELFVSLPLYRSTISRMFWDEGIIVNLAEVGSVETVGPSLETDDSFCRFMKPCKNLFDDGATQLCIYHSENTQPLLYHYQL